MQKHRAASLEVRQEEPEVLTQSCPKRFGLEVATKLRNAKRLRSLGLSSTALKAHGSHQEGFMIMKWWACN